MPDPEARPSIVVPPPPPRSRRGWIITAVLLVIAVGVTLAVTLNRPSAEERADREAIEMAWSLHTIDEQVEMCHDVRELGADTIVRLGLADRADVDEDVLIDFLEEECS